MDRYSIGKKISDIAVKKIKRKYPFIVGGEYRGEFEPTTTYGNKNKLEPEIGFRTLLTVDPEIFFSLFPPDGKAPFINLIMNGNFDTSRYLSTVFYDKEYEALMDEIEKDILSSFYFVGKFVDREDKLGYKDFFVRYKFSNSSPTDDGFTDADVSYYR